MFRRLLLCAALIIPHSGVAETMPDIVAEAVETHILPRYAELVADTAALAVVA